MFISGMIIGSLITIIAIVVMVWVFFNDFWL